MSEVGFRDHVNDAIYSDFIRTKLHFWRCKKDSSYFRSTFVVVAILFCWGSKKPKTSSSLHQHCRVSSLYTFLYFILTDLFVYTSASSFVIVKFLFMYFFSSEVLQKGAGGVKALSVLLLASRLPSPHPLSASIDKRDLIRLID